MHGPEPSNSASGLQVTPIFLFGWCTTVLGVGLRIACFRLLGPRFTFTLSIRGDHALVTSGPYAVVRHPSYTGFMLAWAGDVLCHVSAGSWFAECSGWSVRATGVLWWIWAIWALFLVCVLVPRIVKEDEMLRKQFGTEWGGWSKKVPYCLIPGIY